MDETNSQEEWDEEEEPTMFALGDSAADEDDDMELESTFQLAGFDDDGEVGGFVTSEVVSKGKGPMFGYPEREDVMKVSCSLPAPTMGHMGSERMNRLGSESPPLGASPILLSVLEQVAAGQASSPAWTGRCRAASK